MQIFGAIHKALFEKKWNIRTDGRTDVAQYYIEDSCNFNFLIWLGRGTQSHSHNQIKFDCILYNEIINRKNKSVMHFPERGPKSQKGDQKGTIFCQKSPKGTFPLLVDVLVHTEIGISSKKHG